MRREAKRSATFRQSAAAGPAWRRAGALASAVAVALLATAAHAGVPESLDARYFHRNWRRSDGLPGNSVYAIAQTADGYLWVGTENGLARFDGQRFTSYGNHPAGLLRSRFIAALLADRDGTLWVGTERGLLRLRGGEMSPDGAPDGPASKLAVSVLAQEAGGDLWIGTRSGLLRRGAADAKLTAAGLAGMRVTALLPGGPGEVWIGTEAHGAWHLRAGELAAVAEDRRLRQDKVTGLLRDQDGSILVFTPRAARRLRGGRLVSANLTRSSFSIHGVAAAGASRNSLWLATTDRGPVRIANATAWFASAQHPLAAAVVFSLFVAADHTVWLGSAGDGLHQLVPKSCLTYTRRDGLAYDGTSSVLVEADGTLWAGTLNGLTHMRRQAGGGISAHTELPGAAISALLRDSRGTIWAGTANGLARRTDGRWEILPSWGGPPTLVVVSLLEDPEGRIWVGTAGGLGVISTRPPRTAAVPGLEGQEITGLAVAEDGALWIGTRGAGLVRWRAGKLDTLRSATDLPIVTGIWRGRAHDMWVGTFGHGLLHYQAGRWHQFDEGNGLTDNTIRQLLEDQQGDVWICSGAGISRLAARGIAAVESGRAPALITFSYGPEDGVADGVCNGFAHPGSVRSADGHLWFGTNHGLVEVRPERLASPAPGRAPRLDGAVVDGREVAAAAASRLAISSSTRRLDLRFSAPVFVAQRRTALRYRLVGFDREWTLDGGERLARYTSLPPARYRFEVALRDEWGGWNQPVRLADLEVEPRFYERSSFAALAAFAVAGATAFVYRLGQRRSRRRAAALERLVGQRTEQLRAANLQLEALAGIDALTGLANRRRLQETMEKEVRRAARNRTELSLIMIDVDDFKGYNDSLGHLTGDECLAQVAAALRGGTARAADLVARFGGEEFAVFLPETSGLDARDVAEKLRRQIQELALAHPCSTVASCVTISAGVASLIPPVGCEPSRLIQAADEALYRAKKGGRNQVLLAGQAAVPSRRGGQTVVPLRSARKTG